MNFVLLLKILTTFCYLYSANTDFIQDDHSISKDYYRQLQNQGNQILRNNSYILIILNGDRKTRHDKQIQDYSNRDFNDNNDENNIGFETRRIIANITIANADTKHDPKIVAKNVAVPTNKTNDPKASWSNKKRLEHETRFQEIVEFLKTHYITTIYFYNEINGIRKRGYVRDDLRKMLQYIERTKNTTLRNKVLHCYKLLISEVTHHPFWLLATNNLVLNTNKNPDNDNTMN